MIAVGKIVLSDDGSITVDIPRAAQWCQEHGKWLRIVLGNENEVGTPIIVHGEVSDDIPDFIFGGVPVDVVSEEEFEEAAKLSRRLRELATED